MFSRCLTNTGAMALGWKLDALIALAVLLYTQLGIFYFASFRCAHRIGAQATESAELRALVVSDVHLLGKRRRTRIERAWIDLQIAASLRAAVSIHRPEVLLVLGDQLDEGGLATSDVDWEEYIQRFNAAFRAASGLETLYLIGNHDASFGRYLSPRAISRHERGFGPSNRQATIHGHKIIVLNTMALDSDVVNIEVKAEASRFFEMLERDRQRNPTSSHSTILLTHFPLFRRDDLQCGSERLREGGHVTYEHPAFPYEVHHHVLSANLSSELLLKIQPDAIISGHTHAWCEYRDEDLHHTEFTIPAFTWGQRPDPSYALVFAEGTQVRAVQCALPHEPTVFMLYGALVVWLLARILWRQRAMSSAGHARRHAKLN